MEEELYWDQAQKYCPESYPQNPCKIFSVNPSMNLRLLNGKLQQQFTIEYKYDHDVSYEGRWTKFGEVNVWLNVVEVKE